MSPKVNLNLSRFQGAILFALVLALMAAVAIPAARADTLLYATSFESSTFATGPIAGQDGWGVFGPSSPQIVTPFAKTGLQSVFVDGAIASQSGPFHNDPSTGPVVDLSADLAIFTGADQSRQSEWQFAGLGPAFGPAFLGGIDVLPDSSIEAITAGFPVIGTFTRATAFDGTAWHHVDLLFNIAAQTYNISVDSITLASNVPFCGDNSGCAGAVVTQYGAGFFDDFGNSSGHGSANTNDSGYMDNYSVSNISATAVPEPSSILLLVTLLGGIGVMLRRKTSPAV